MAFVIGIIFIVTADTGLITSYYPALIAGIIISCFAGVFLAIYLYAWHKQSKWDMLIPVYRIQKFNMKCAIERMEIVYTFYFCLFNFKKND